VKDVQILWVNTSQMQPDTGVKKHTHDYLHMVQVMQGKLRFLLEDKEFLLEAGDIVLADKGVVHRFWNESGEVVRFCEIKFTLMGPGLTQLTEKLEKRVIRDPFAARLLEQVESEYRQCRSMRDDAATAALKTLLLYLTEEARLSAKDGEGVIDTTGYSKLSKRVIAYLTAHYPEDLSLDDISEGVGITKNYLCNAFKQNTGTTIIECLNMIRVRKAAEQLVYSDLPLTQVAQMCGYVSASHFNRVFLRYVGTPPGQCRRVFSYDLTTRTQRPGLFMYSVLAGKSISLSAVEDENGRAKPAPDLDKIN